MRARVRKNCDSAALPSNERDGFCALSAHEETEARETAESSSGVRNYSELLFFVILLYFYYYFLVMISSKRPVALLLEWKCLHRVLF